MNNLRAKLVIAIVEAATAGILAYRQLPSDQQQRIRMAFYHRASVACHHVGYRIARLEVQMHERYVREGAANG